MIDPASVPVHYYNVIEDLLLAILNKLPAPNGNPAAFLDCTFNWAVPAGGVGTTLPTGDRRGDILTWDTVNNVWAVWMRKGAFQFNVETGSGTIGLEVSDTIRIGDAEILTDGFDGFRLGSNLLLSGALGWDDYEKTITPNGNNLEVNCPLKTEAIFLSGDISMKNKAGDAFQGFARRDDTGAYSYMNLLNIGQINDPATDNIGIYAANRELFFRNGPGRIGTKDDNPLTFATNNSLRYSIDTAGNFLPAVTSIYSLGSNAYKMCNAWFNGFVQASQGLTTGNNLWLLNNCITQAGQTLNTGQYISVSIGGTQYKIATLN